MFNIIQWKRKGGITAAVGTAIMALLDPGNIQNGRVIITRLAITTLGTAQTLTVMQVLGKYRIAAAAAAAQKVIRFADASMFAANDILAIKMPNGRHEKYTVSSVGGVDVDGLYPVTLVEDLSAPLAKASAVCFFGVPADGHEQVALPASTASKFESDEGYFGANEQGEPLLLHVTNATNAATINAINYPLISV